MKKIALLLVFVLMSLFLASCGNEGDILATYSDGNKKVEVSRGEFYKHLGGRKKMALSSKRRQAGYLERFVLDMIKVVDAKKLGYDKDADFKKQVKDHIEKKLLISALFKEKFPRKGLKFSVDSPIIRHIIIKNDKFKTIIALDPSRFKKMAAARKTIKNPTVLKKKLAQLKNLKKSTRVKLSKAELRKQDKVNFAKINKILGELKAQKGKNFNALAKRYSQDGTKKKGGLLGYVFSRQKNLDKTFLKAALKLKAGEMTGVVKTKFGYHIIKCDKVVKITDKNIGEFEKDKRKLNGMKRNIWYSVVWKFIDSTLANDKNVKQDLAALRGRNKKAIIFSIDSKEYQYKISLGEYIKKMQAIPPRALSRYGIKRSLKDKNKRFTAKELKAYYDWFVTYPVLKYGAYKVGATKSAFFIKSLNKIKFKILASIADKKISERIKIPAKTVRSEYLKNKSKYRKAIRQSAKDRKMKKKLKYKQLSFKEAKDRIEKSLKRSLVRKKIASLIRDLKKKYNYKVFLNELEVVKPTPRKRRSPRRMAPRKMPVRAKKK